MAEKSDTILQDFLFRWPWTPSTSRVVERWTWPWASQGWGRSSWSPQTTSRLPASTFPSRRESHRRRWRGSIISIYLYQSFYLSFYLSLYQPIYLSIYQCLLFVFLKPWLNCMLHVKKLSFQPYKIFGFDRFCKSNMALTGYPPGLALFCIFIYCSVMSALWTHLNM